jgi:hypothetical protein
VLNNVYHLDIEFFHTGDEKNVDVKKVELFVNADPKDLWKNIPSDKMTTSINRMKFHIKDVFR